MSKRSLRHLNDVAVEIAPPKLAFGKWILPKCETTLEGLPLNLFLVVPEDIISVIMSKISKAHMNILSCSCKFLYNSISQIVKKLDLRQYFHIDSTTKIEGSLSRYVNLSELYMGNGKLKMTTSFPKILFSLNLRVFSAPNLGLTNYFLIRIAAGLPELEVLNIAGNKTNMKVMWLLTKLTNLKSLDISYSNGLANSDIGECLSQFKLLRELSLAGIPLKNFDASSLASLENLRSLNASETTMKPLFASLSLTNLTFLNFIPAGRPIELPDTLDTLDVDIGTFYYIPPGKIGTLCIRKLNDFVDDLLSMTERSSVKTLELRQFKIMINVFLSGVTFLLKRMPNVTTLLLDLYWDDQIGKFDDNLHLFFTSIKSFENLKNLYLRVEITTHNKGAVQMIWQALISVIIQQRTQLILSQFETGIAIIFREGCHKTGKSLICRYDGKWWTTKRFLRIDEKVAIPGNTSNLRNK